MMKRLWMQFAAVVLGLGAVDCIGTEYINDPVSTATTSQLVVTPSNTALEVGQMLQLQAMFNDGSSVSSTQWRTSDSAIVSVSATGVATGRNPGQARITAEANGVTSEPALVNVVSDANQVARVVVSPASSQRSVGGTQQFTATAYNLNNVVVSGVTPQWSSSNPAIASINANGVALANSNGVATISATIDGIVSNAAQLTVSSSSRTGVFVMRPNSGHDVRGTATLTRQAGGSLLLSFGSDFASAGGPDVRVYLSTTNAVSPASLSLGPLQRFSGAQTYPVPAGVQLTTYDWVIVHCVPFNITFGYARLQ